MMEKMNSFSSEGCLLNIWGENEAKLFGPLLRVVFTHSIVFIVLGLFKNLTICNHDSSRQNIELKKKSHDRLATVSTRRIKMRLDY